MTARAPEHLYPAYATGKERSWFTTSTVALVISVILALAFALSPIGLLQPDSGGGEPSSSVEAP